jgi:hypothetical protein
MLSDARTIYDFTTWESGKTPKEIAEDYSLIEKPRENKNKEQTGVCHLKCIELLDDWKTFRNKPKIPRPREKLKKMPRAHSAITGVEFMTPKKVNSVFQKISSNKLDKNFTADKNADIVSWDDSFEGDHLDDLYHVLKKYLNPIEIKAYPTEFLKGNWTYYYFSGTIGKQSKVMKRIMERKIKLDPVEGTITEYKDLFDYPDKPNRVGTS